MSKQSQAKEDQGYEAKRVWPVCSNCKDFQFEKETWEGMDPEKYFRLKNLRCRLGGFKVMKNGTCDKHVYK